VPVVLLEEMRRLGSLIMRAGDALQVPALSLQVFVDMARPGLSRTGSAPTS